MDAVIASLVAQAENNNIEIQTDCNLPAEMDVQDEYCLCIILSNLLRNAVEACQMLETERIILISVKMYQSQIIIDISNTTANQVKIKQNKLVTTKKDKKNHGLGSENVYYMVQSRNGILNYSNEKGWFKAEVILP